MDAISEETLHSLRNHVRHISLASPSTADCLIRIRWPCLSQRKWIFKHSTVLNWARQAFEEDLVCRSVLLENDYMSLRDTVTILMRSRIDKSREKKTVTEKRKYKEKEVITQIVQNYIHSSRLEPVHLQSQNFSVRVCYKCHMTCIQLRRSKSLLKSNRTQ